MPISYADALSAIIEEPAPVLYLDTCVLLDIVRAPVRENIDSNSAQFAHVLEQRSSSSPRSLWLITSETVESEWQDNIDGVVEEVEREILKLESKRRHFLSAANVVINIQYQHGQIESSIGLGEKLRNASQSLLDACTVVSPDDVHLVRAMKRVKQYLPPAQRGKAEAKDCEIYELFWSLCQELRACGVVDNFVFSSSNTKEYGNDNSGGIQPELNKIRAQYATSLAWVMAILDGRA